MLSRSHIYPCNKKNVVAQPYRLMSNMVNNIDMYIAVPAEKKSKKNAVFPKFY